MRVYIITSAKFEECCIEEWVQYHLNMGFDKIIINDDNPRHYKYKLKNILKKYINSGQVIIKRYHDIFEYYVGNPDKELPKIYTWILNQYKDEFDWCAKLDIDEYLEIPETNNDVKKFLSLDKFKDIYQICVPLIPFKVKQEYSNKYTRLKVDRNRFEEDEIDYVQKWRFKSIIRNNKNLTWIGNHNASFNSEYNKNKIYVLPDGNNRDDKFCFNNTNDYILNEEKKIFYYLANNICKINHYCDKSYEEYIIKILRYECNTINNINVYINNWDEFYKENKELIDNPRDLYKLYFIDNINNIKD